MDEGVEMVEEEVVEVEEAVEEVEVEMEVVTADAREYVLLLSSPMFKETRVEVGWWPLDREGEEGVGLPERAERREGGG